MSISTTDITSSEISEKYNHLQDILRSMGQVVVAFSGGVDSTFLLKVAVDVLGSKDVLAVTADSETYPAREREQAVALAKDIGARHTVIQTSELAIPGYAENPTNRCYFCKQELFTQIAPIAKQHSDEGIVIFGAIADDLGDYRPGLQAARDLGVRAPLIEANLYKSEIRHLSRLLGLQTWDKPSFACLSSRIPYGDRITIEKLSMIDRAEAFLMQLGFRQIRVRQHDKLARIEVPSDKLVEVARVADTIAAKLKEIGYTYVSLDLQGYRSGSLNEVLPEATSKTAAAETAVAEAKVAETTASKTTVAETAVSG